MVEFGGSLKVATRPQVAPAAATEEVGVGVVGVVGEIGVVVVVGGGGGAVVVV